MSISTENKPVDWEPLLREHNIGVSASFGQGDPIFRAFVQPPTPIFCLYANSDEPTRNEAVFMMAYQEYLVDRAGCDVHKVERRNGVPFVPGGNTEVWHKKDGRWFYRKSSWGFGSTWTGDCETVEELANYTDHSEWAEFSAQLAYLFPLAVKMKELRFVPTRIAPTRSHPRRFPGREETAPTFHVIDPKPVSDQLWGFYVVDCNIRVIYTDPEDLEVQKSKEFDLKDPDCYDDAEAFIIMIQRLHALRIHDEKLSTNEDQEHVQTRTP